MKSFLFSLLFSTAYAFPWVANMPGVQSPWSKHRKLAIRQQTGDGPGGPNTCPFNPNHKPAHPITKKYPYNNAKNGLPGNGKGGYQVPAKVSIAFRVVTEPKN